MYLLPGYSLGNGDLLVHFDISGPGADFGLLLMLVQCGSVREHCSWMFCVQPLLHKHVVPGCCIATDTSAICLVILRFCILGVMSLALSSRLRSFQSPSMPSSWGARIVSWQVQPVRLGLAMVGCGWSLGMFLLIIWSRPESGEVFLLFHHMLSNWEFVVYVFVLYTGAWWRHIYYQKQQNRTDILFFLCICLALHSNYCMGCDDAC